MKFDWPSSYCKVIIRLFYFSVSGGLGVVPWLFLALMLSVAIAKSAAI